MSLLRKLLGKAAKSRSFDKALEQYLQDLWLGLGTVNLARTAEASGGAQAPLGEERIRRLLTSMLQLPLHSLSLAMLAAEMATALADELQLPERDRRALGEAILRRFGSDSVMNDVLVEAHADSVAQMFPEGGAATMTLNTPQIDFVLGVLAGNHLAGDFLRCWRADGEQPKPSQLFVDETARALLPSTIPGERVLPEGRQVVFLRRAYRPEVPKDGGLAWALFDLCRRQLTDLTIEQSYVRDLEGRAPLGLAVMTITAVVGHGTSLGVETESTFNIGVALLRECLGLSKSLDSSNLGALMETVAREVERITFTSETGAPAPEVNLAGAPPEAAGALLGRLLLQDSLNNRELHRPLRASLWQRAKASRLIP